MMDYLIQDNTLTGIADGVRDISGETENLSPAQMTTELGNAGDEVDDQNGILQTLIQTIESKQKGEPDLIEKTVNANGTYNASTDNADGYSKVIVNVPEPSGNKDITAETSTQTGIDVKDYATVSVAPTPTETKTATVNGTVTPTSGKFLSSVTVSIPVYDGTVI